jgi:4-hydroxythreonine-4-phosphate dehydrogenase
MNRLLKVGISHGSGDTHSYELLARLMASPELMELCTPIVFGNAEAAQAANQSLPTGPDSGLEPAKWNVINKLQEAAEGRANLFEAFEGSADEAALKAGEEGQVQVVLSLSTAENPSETPAPTALTALRTETTAYFNADVTEETTASLLDALRRIHKALRRDTTELRPRIAIILPTQSTLGTTVLHDVCRTLREEGILAFGPTGEESFTDAAMAEHYDAIVLPGDAEALQRLTADVNPAKAFRLVTERRYVQVSPVAAQHPEDEMDSLRYALYSALDIWRNRRRYDAATRSPLEKQWNPRGKDDVKLDLTKDVDAD